MIFYTNRLPRLPTTKKQLLFLVIFVIRRLLADSGSRPWGVCMGVNPLGTGGTRPPKVCVGGTPVALSPPKLSDDTGH